MSNNTQHNSNLFQMILPRWSKAHMDYMLFTCVTNIDLLLLYPVEEIKQCIFLVQQFFISLSITFINDLDREELLLRLSNNLVTDQNIRTNARKATITHFRIVYKVLRPLLQYNNTKAIALFQTRYAGLVSSAMEPPSLLKLSYSAILNTSEIPDILHHHINSTLQRQENETTQRALDLLFDKDGQCCC